MSDRTSSRWVGPARLIASVILAAVGMACGAPTAPTSAPTATPNPPAAATCAYEISAAHRAQSVGPQGGLVEIAVSTALSCEVEASSQHDFLQVVPRPISRGDAIIRVVVAPNGGPQRVGTLTVSGVTVTITQRAAAACTLGVSPVVLDVDARGGDAAIAVSVLQGQGCDWQVVSQAPFVSIVSGDSGRDAGQVVLRVAPNPADARTGIVAVAGVDVRVEQRAPEPPGSAPCEFGVTPASLAAPASGIVAEFRIALTSGTACAWTAHSQNAFLRIEGPAAGDGDATIRVNVEPNGGPARSGTLLVAGTTVTVSQAAAAACVSQLSPAATTFQAAGGSALVSVTARQDCSWSVTTEGAFLNAPAGPQTGPGTFTLTVAANLTPVARQGRLIVGDAAVVISQSASQEPPSPPPGVTTYFSLLSEPGDSIGQGRVRFDPLSTTAFSASVFGGGNAVEINVLPADGSRWRLVFAAPSGAVLQPGAYEGASRHPFQPASTPGLDFSGEGRGCNRLTGRFHVHEAVFAAGGSVDRFRVSFEQHCEGQLPAAFGEVALVAPFGPAPGPPPPAPGPPTPTPGTTTLLMSSDAGDYIGLGQTYAYTNAGVFQVSTAESGRTLTVRIMQGVSLTWTLSFAAPVGQRLAVGTYDGATRYPFQSPVAPGLDVSGMGRGCNTLTGRFVVHEIAYGAGDSIEHLRLTFEQHCEGFAPAFRGDLTIIGNPPR